MRGIAIVEATELSEFTNYAHILMSMMWQLWSLRGNNIIDYRVEGYPSTL